MLYIVAAISDNNIVGVNGELPWRLKNELRWFRMNTVGGAVIMGRKTWDSLPLKPLPGRLNIILTRNPTRKNLPNVIWKHSLKESIRYARAHHSRVYIIGGSAIFKQALAFHCSLLITRVHCTVSDDNECCEFVLPRDKTLVWRSRKRRENGTTYHHELYIT